MSTTMQVRRRNIATFGVARPLTRKRVQEMLRRNQSFTDADLRGVDLSGLCFDGADLRGAKLAEADLQNCSFRKANLSGASMWQANLQNAVLDRANLEDTDMDMANLDGCTFQGARIRKAIFPLQRRSLLQVEESIRTGCKISLPHDVDEDTVLD